MVRAHRQAWCWQDEWYGLDLTDIRRLERQTQEELAERMGNFSDNESSDNNSSKKRESIKRQSEIDINNDEILIVNTSKSNQEVTCSRGQNHEHKEVSRTISPTGAHHRRSFSNSSKTRSQGMYVGQGHMVCI